MKVLITGGAGFIGSQLAYYLWKRNPEIDITLVDNMSYGHTDNLQFPDKTFDYWALDVTHDIHDVLGPGYDYIFHFAGIAPLPVCQSQPVNAVVNNVAGTANMLEYARKTGCKRFIFASTGAIYENASHFDESITVPPDLIYATTKLQAEQLCHSYSSVYNMETVCIRFFNVYGPHQDFRRKSPPLIGYLLKQALNNEVAVLHSDGNQSRDYIYIDDLCRLLLKTMLSVRMFYGTPINAGSGESVSVKQIVSEIQKHLPLQVRYQAATKFWDSYPELQQGAFKLRPERLEKEVNKSSKAKIDRAKFYLNWSPIFPLSQGIEKVCKFAKDNICAE